LRGILPRGGPSHKALEFHDRTARLTHFSPIHSSPGKAPRGRETLVTIERVAKAKGLPTPDEARGERWRDRLHNGKVYAVAFLPGDRFVSCGADHRVVRRSAKGNSVSTTYGTEVPGVLSIAVSPDGKTLVSGAEDAIRVWSLKGYHLVPVRKLDLVTEAAHSVALSPDGRYIAGSLGERGWKLWEVATGRVVHSFGGYHTDTFTGPDQMGSRRDRSTRSAFPPAPSCWTPKVT
jgi:WD40 repeat protein